MAREAIFAVAFVALAGLSPASAQWSVGVGVGYGAPDYYGPPPIIYGEPPIIYGPPPVYVYEEPPVYLPAPSPPVAIPSAVPPAVVFDNLERSGYRELGPMAFRDGFYKLSAVNRRGDLVALEVSLLTGQVQLEFVIGATTHLQPVAPPAPVLPPAASPAPAGDPLVVY